MRMLIVLGATALVLSIAFSSFAPTPAFAQKKSCDEYCLGFCQTAGSKSYCLNKCAQTCRANQQSGH
jgi:hypothetical protein